ncbi:MAG: ankyrin repeat domain-containing protein [Legionellaceae bacterium]|nr:ankyrin repeat domain-containing protein [Legionellaceae bacterium]
MTKLHTAAVNGDRTKVSALLSDDDDIAALAHELNENPLYSALALPASHTKQLKIDKEVIFEQLLALSRDVLAHQNRDGDTVLHRLAKNDFRNLLNSVLSEDNAAALLRIQNSVGMSPIHTAVLNGRTDMAARLMGYDGVAVLADADNNLPLHLAAAYGNFEIVKACYEAYPDAINLKNGQAKTPLDLAGESNKSAVQKYLSDQGGKHNPAASWSDTYVTPNF